MNTNSIGEAMITPQVAQNIAPDVVSPSGQEQLKRIMAHAMQQQQSLDFLFKSIADKMGAEFSSRIKNPETVVQKIGQKRLAGRDYNLSDVNDIYGSRIIVKSENKIPNITRVIKKIADAGVFSIKKSEMVDTPYHRAYHIDFQTNTGTPGEVQILTGREEANSAVNHDLRSVYGEKMPQRPAALAAKQANTTQGLSHSRAHQLAQSISRVHQAAGDKPLSPVVNAALLSAVAKRS